ncbi:hypothetical protein, partial [Desulfobacter hydrogenophilus]|uniref:hypothetical protein n=1 Tax=Desulfobacter hydrogenophilus TaxID=2291 RepID=UPI00201321C4
MVFIDCGMQAVMKKANSPIRIDLKAFYHIVPPTEKARQLDPPKSFGNAEPVVSTSGIIDKTLLN